ncbi:PilZ domain-containing protein [Salinisphaera sp.]|uniref:PilZ domain-containing protein n=1 Tax=Salinisphaera sp. TaxID=1914330 RepID=UPI002D7A1F29|nr:PilZ domain-containing protein [Salinisphaera sp.]HET7313702.1 PilZ domain-containing protein [Salinisphaera sp.]
MPAHADNPYTLITDADAIAAALADLHAQAEPVLLRAMADGGGHHVALADIETSPPRLVWQHIDAGQTMPIAAGDMLQLEARRRAGHLVSSAMRCDLVSQDARAGRLALCTCLPMRLTLRHARHDWRARPADEMTVAARLTRPEAPPVAGVLVDLSVGGCRLALADGDVTIEPDEWVNLRLVFPNGEESVFGARVGDVAVQAGASIQLGLIFAGLSDEQARRLWFLTCEIDREAERRQHDRGELRPLAPSPLFQISP